MSIIETKGNILESDCKYIVQQCNCKTVGDGAGLAFQINEKFPYANTYKVENKRESGTIEIMGNGKNERFIINAYAQKYPGRPTHYETKEIRLDWFLECLRRIALIDNLESVAFPYGIGCGLAGGNWESYLKLITKFEKFVSKKGCKVFIVKFD